MNAPVKIHSGVLWSLGEMQRFYGERLAKVWQSLALVNGHLRSENITPADIAQPRFKAAMSHHLQQMREVLSELELLASEKQVNRIQFSIDAAGNAVSGYAANVTAEDLGREFNELGRRIHDELDGVYLLKLNSNEATLFEPPSPPFGGEVSMKFTSAAYDIAESAKCLALNLSTAAAFHSIRSLEAAIRALSRCLNIPDPTKAHERSWFRLLEALKGQIDQKWPTNADRLAGDGQFFDQAYAALAALQNPWRNATMHLDQKYTQAEAQQIFDTVRGFMRKLAGRMDENGDPLA